MTPWAPTGPPKMRDLSESSQTPHIWPRHPEGVVVDPVLPAAPYLFGEHAHDLVAAGVSALGGRLHRLEVAHVGYRPERDLVVRYRADVSWADGEPVEETLLAGTTIDGPPPGTLPLEAGDLSVGLWRYPFDPRLPGLAAAVVPREVLALVGPFVGDHVRLRVRSYRPTRRAVVHVVGDRGELYLKVLPVDAVAGLVDLHDQLIRTMPVPEVVGVDTDAGIVALRALPGETLRARITSGRPPWPDADAVLDVLDRLAGAVVPADRPPVPAPRRTAHHHADLVARVLPAATDRLHALCAALGDAAPDTRGVAHGDLHDGQLTVDGDRIVGVLDVDGAGPGDRIDDLGNLLGHLSTVALAPALAAGPLPGHVDALHARLARAVDPVELARAAAATVVGLSTGPFRAQDPAWEAETFRRLDLAAQWLARVGITVDPATGDRRLDERSLNPAS